jgi:hypothetical protein
MDRERREAGGREHDHGIGALSTPTSEGALPATHPSTRATSDAVTERRSYDGPGRRSYDGPERRTNNVPVRRRRDTDALVVTALTIAGTLISAYDMFILAVGLR